jgi:hypothetical protein
MSLIPWPRRHFQPGGGDAFLLYQVFGRFEAGLDISEVQYRTAGVPSGLDLVQHTASRHPEAFGWFKPGYLWDLLLKDQPELARAVDEAPACLRLQGTVQDPSTLDFFRDAIGVLTAATDAGGVAVFDPQSFKWWSPEEWRKQVFEPAGPVPRHHVIILTSEEEGHAGTEWIHTRGMRKFGRPDLSIHAVPPRYREGVIDLCDRFIEMQAFGAVIPQGQQIRMESLPEGLTCHHQGNLEDNEFNNVHIDIRFQGGIGMYPG